MNNLIKKIMETVAVVSISMFKMLKMTLLAFIIMCPFLPWPSQDVCAIAFFGSIIWLGFVIGIESKVNL